MDQVLVQNILAGILLLVAVGYLANKIIKKTHRFSPKSTCQNDCDCGQNE